MKDTLAWAIVDKDGDILLWAIYASKEAAMQSHWRSHGERVIRVLITGQAKEEKRDGAHRNTNTDRRKRAKGVLGADTQSEKKGSKQAEITKCP